MRASTEPGSGGPLEDATVQTVSPPCPPSAPGREEVGGGGSPQSYPVIWGGMEGKLSLTPILQMKGLRLGASNILPSAHSKEQWERCPNTSCIGVQPVQESLGGRA